MKIWPRANGYSSAPCRVDASADFVTPLFCLSNTVVDDIVVEHDHVVARAGLDHADLAMEGLKLTMKGKKETKEILDGSIRVRAQPGRMLAIMGPSGTPWWSCLIGTPSQSSPSSLTTANHFGLFYGHVHERF